MKINSVKFLEGMSDEMLQTFYDRCISLKVEKERKLLDDAFKKIKTLADEIGIDAIDLANQFIVQERHGYMNQESRVMPKYQNPSTGEIWSGRGKKPRWLQEALNAGFQQDQFLIKK